MLQLHHKAACYTKLKVHDSLRHQSGFEEPKALEYKIETYDSKLKAAMRKLHSNAVAGEVKVPEKVICLHLINPFTPSPVFVQVQKFFLENL